MSPLRIFMDEERTKIRADLRELGRTLREFAALEAKKRNWGSAQRICGLAMSAWQLFVQRRRHRRFLARERARGRGDVPHLAQGRRPELVPDRLPRPLLSGPHARAPAPLLLPPSSLSLG